MLKTILSISGKPGLYKLISQGKNMLIVETIDATKKRFHAYGNEKIISLADIAMYTNDSEVPLRDVLRSIKEKENAAIASIDVKKATSEQLREYLAEVLPDFPQHVSGRGTENMFRHQCPLSSAIQIIWENDMGKATGTKPRAPSLRITVVSCGGFHLADCAVQSTTAPWWNVREITSSCCSLVSLTKFTA